MGFTSERIRVHRLDVPSSAERGGASSSSPPIHIPKSTFVDEDAEADAAPDSFTEYREYAFWRRMSKDGRDLPSPEARPDRARRRSRSDPAHRVAFFDDGAAANAGGDANLMFSLDEF